MGAELIFAILCLILAVSLHAILSFGLSQAWLATRYRASKASNVAAMPEPDLPDTLPRVLIQLPIFNERYVVERLLEATVKIDYPSNLLTIQLLDDSTDDTSIIASAAIDRLNALGGHQVTHVRRENRVGFKAGAMKHGMNLNDSPFIAIFDADFLPKPSFVKSVVPYFNDPKMGMVQTRWEHINENHSALTKLMAFAIDNHFSVEQGGRQASDCFINFNGTAGMWRRATIVQAGGWSDDCLTEDLDLSFRAQLQGWKFLFLEQYATPSELPAEIAALRTQQARWTKGAVETSKKNLGLLWHSKESAISKIVGSFHMLNSSVYLPVFVTILASAALPFFAGASFLLVSALIHIVMLTSGALILYTYWTSRSVGNHGKTIESPFHIFSMTMFFMVMISGFSLLNSRAVIQGLAGRATPFVRTPKHSLTNEKQFNSPPMQYSQQRFPIEFYFEALVAIYLLAVIAYCIDIGTYAMIDIYTYFAAGFLAMVYFTLRDRFQVRRSAKAHRDFVTP
jgi:cellulose synthase/poly-beta-1,6-N-acetylglucosamine synthase-like glycosyltransferase